MTEKKQQFVLNKLSKSSLFELWQIVEDDKEQYAFVYVLRSDSLCTVIDSGTGSASLLEFINTHINVEQLPYQMILTHVHFDHVGGAHEFADAELMMSAAAPQFSLDVQQHSLIELSNSAPPVKPFAVTRWLADGDTVFLSEPADEALALRVVASPGHTPDSLSLVFDAGMRIFVADTLYPYADIGLDCVGGDFQEFRATVRRLCAEVKAMAARNAHLQADDDDDAPPPLQLIQLSCGHIEANLAAHSSLPLLLELIENIANGSQEVMNVIDDEKKIVQYSNGMFSITMHSQ